MPEEKKDEMYAKVPDSYEDKMSKIRDAIRKSTLFGAVENEWSLSIEATFADSIIIDKSTKEGAQYYKADWSINADGDVVFSNVKAVTVEAVVKIKNENEELKDEDVGKSSAPKILNEEIEGTLLLEEVTDPITGITRYKGSTTLPNYAEVKNKNKRWYSKKIITEAIQDLSDRIKTNGASPIYRGHIKEIDKNGKEINTSGLDRIVGGLSEVSYDPIKNAVSLADIEIADTADGRDIVALASMKIPIRFRYSHRGSGGSHLVKNEQNEVTEIVDSLKIDGFDILLAGRESVKQPDMEFRAITEEAEMPDKKVLTEEEVDQKLEGIKTSILDEIKNIVKPEEKKDEQKVEEKKLDEEKKEEKPGKSVEALNEMQKKLDEVNEFIETGKRKEAIALMVETGEGVINEALKDEKYKAFTADDKKHIIGMVTKDIPSLYGKVDTAKPDDFKAGVVTMLNEHYDELMPFVARTRLESKGYGNPQGNGIQTVEVIRAELPNGERIGKLEEAIDQALDPDKEHYKLPNEHRFNGVINEVMDSYYKEHYKELMNESGENFTQSDIGASIRSINAAIIPAALKRLTATRYCNVFSMKALREDILIESLLPAIGGNGIHTNVALLQPTEDGQLSTVGSTLTPYPMIATEKGFNTRISAKAIATAKNSIIDPIALCVASISKQMAQIMDQYIWEWIIARAQAYSKDEVTSVETLTQVGSTNEYQSANQGWILYEVYRDTTSANPTDAKLVNLFGTAVGTPTYQQIIVTNSNDDAFTYGTHYTINAADGSITLTAAGVTLKSSYDMRAVYSYTTNAKFWSVTGGGSTENLYTWLVNLQQRVGQAKATIRTRGYEPDFAITDITVEDLISKGPQFDASKAQPGSVKDALGNVNTYDGLPIDRAGWLPSGWLVVGKKGTSIGGAQLGIHTPMIMNGPKLTATYTYQDYDMNGFDAIDYPNNAETILVGITDLTSL